MNLIKRGLAMSFIGKSRARVNRGAVRGKEVPRVTIATENAREKEKALRGRGVGIVDPAQAYDEFYVGSFLDSEGNKPWFCSPV